jgi:methylmalonyl-CoA/ethylmalonyl-CoA epimerase
VSVQGIHHINFIVRDIDDGVRQYERILGEGSFLRDELPARGVITARADLGGPWLVLVQPLDPDSVPGQHLEKHGEGFFLLSLSVPELASSVALLEGRGVAFADSGERKGLLDWWVRDLQPDATHGVQLQLCEERER